MKCDCGADAELFVRKHLPQCWACGCQEIRRGLAFSQAELARNLGVTREFVNRIENGRRFPGKGTRLHLLRLVVTDLQT